MQAILKHLEDATNECSMRIAECAKIKKEYEAKLADLRNAELRLRDMGIELDAREGKVKRIENLVEYSRELDARAEKVKADEVALGPK